MIPIVLKVYDGGKLKSSRAFRAERIRLGSESADLVLESPGIAPTHAVIETGVVGAVLRATTAAPLYLNGQPILAAPLRHGDLISIGELRIMVELQARTLHALGPQKSRPRLQLIHGEEEPLVERPHQPAPALQVVREEILAEVEAATDEGLNDDLALVPFEPPPAEPAPAPAPAPPPVVPTPPPPSESAAAAVRAEPGTPVPTTALPPITTPLGGECAEVELFWGDTRVSVWQLQPGEQFHAGSAPGCQALLHGIERAAVVRSDVNGWTVAAPRPLQLFLEDDGKVLGGPELLVRGRSQADAHGLIVPLPQRSVAVLSSGSLALRIRRVRGAARVGGEQTDWKGVLVASIAAILMVTGMKFWSATVPPPKVSAGDPELIKPRPLVVRAAPPKPNNAPVLDAQKVQNQARRDPGKAVARHQGQEGAAGSKTAPRRDARAERKMDDRALIAEIGLLKALGGGSGKSDVFGVALEKGTRDAMGHLSGPRIGDAQGDGGMGLKSLGGRGGGGDGSGLGLARIGTNGIGGGLANYGDGKGGLRGKENGEIGLGPGKPEVVGSIDPELIRKVVHEHRAQIRTCYETQLTTRPNLAGKLVSAWTIDPAGAVTEAHTQESTLHDRSVETCVAAKIKTWRFPIPKGGGEVFVTYPFIFTPGG
ncbi:MAG: FHA domain-containing protein [Deltaproteobacteria bacterium]|nr:MAG: FHA domain-containing protein [Deltaproteobacteria bacterium]